MKLIPLTALIALLPGALSADEPREDRAKKSATTIRLIAPTAKDPAQAEFKDGKIPLDQLQRQLAPVARDISRVRLEIPPQLEYQHLATAMIACAAAAIHDVDLAGAIDDTVSIRFPTANDFPKDGSGPTTVLINLQTREGKTVARIERIEGLVDLDTGLRKQLARIPAKPGQLFVAVIVPQSRTPARDAVLACKSVQSRFDRVSFSPPEDPEEK